MSVCGNAQWDTLSESWSIFKLPQLLKNLLEYQKKVPSSTEVYFYDNWGISVYGTGKQAEYI